MKKIISLFCTTILVISVFSFNVITAFAKEAYPKVDFSQIQDFAVFVNDEVTDDIIVTYDSDKEQHIFKYDGKGIVTEWQFPRAEENKDYKIVSKSNNEIVIKLINKYKAIPYINAVVDLEKKTDTSNITENKTQESSTLSETSEQISTVNSSTEITTDKNENTAEKSLFNAPNNIIFMCVIGVAIGVTVTFVITKNKKSK